MPNKTVRRKNLFQLFSPVSGPAYGGKPMASFTAEYSG
jgi:orotate phosphoribosyltransferase